MADSPNSPDRADGIEERFAFIHREVLKLVGLIVIAVGAFFVTRAIAANNHTVALQDAAEWYVRGQRELERGDADRAVEAFRHATVKNRDERRYVLALAGALVTTKQDVAARSALLALRESAPEDPDINLQLARLDADRQDMAEAVRYYHNALYATWPAEQSDARRRVRIELIRFLLTHGQASRAESELVALSADLPDEPAAHVEAAQLFVSAGDHVHALDQFQRALRLAPGDGAALAGAGLAAFATGDYPLAQQYLGQAPEEIAGVKETRSLVDLVLSNDPFAARIGSPARRRRLLDGLSYASQRVAACGTRQPGGQPSAPQLTLRQEAETMSAELRRSAVVESDTLESAVDLIYRLELDLTRTCPPPDSLDRAWLLIAERHGVSQR